MDVCKTSKVRIVAVSKSLHINGNQHGIDASQLRLLTDEERKQSIEQGAESWEFLGSILGAEPWTQEGPKIKDVEGTFTVKMYDLDVKGHTSINHEASENGAFRCGYGAAINVGASAYSAKYIIDIQNVSASSVKDGFKIESVIGGTFKNAYAYDCYQNGFKFRSSIVAVENLKLGACGAVGIELTPEASDKAGVNSNQNQEITFLGELDALGNFHTLDTTYLNAYTVDFSSFGLGKKTVADLVTTSIQVNSLTDNQLAHLSTDWTDKSKMKLCMVSFIMQGNAPNSSEAKYPAYQGTGGIIDATKLPTSGEDTTHQFIQMTVYVAPGVSLGTILLYNLNYKGA